MVVITQVTCGTLEVQRTRDTAHDMLIHEEQYARCLASELHAVETSETSRYIHCMDERFTVLSCVSDYYNTIQVGGLKPLPALACKPSGSWEIKHIASTL
jgi:hypothetical protein